MVRTQRFLAVVAVVLAAYAAPLLAQQNSQPIDPSLYSSMRWRLIGPYRAGRVSAVAGIPGDPAVYYMGTPGGGVWKTTDAGRVWKPIFDDQHVASIGAVAIAPSNRDIVYVGTGEQTHGNGMYKSTDAGATWTRIGLEDIAYITSIIVDPRDPNIIVVGALGHPILSVSLPSPARGIFKTTNGGKTWTKTLYKDDMAGPADTVVDPENPRVLYTALWKPYDFRTGPPADNTQQDSWIYKSTDEGSTWKQLPETGLPTTDPLGRIGLAVAPGTHGKRVFAITEAGFYRSDDAGATWRQITKDSRVTGNLYFSRVFVDPNNTDIVYVMQTTVYRSTDGGQNFTAFKGAPGGDDYHVLWIDPKNSQRMILGVDQGSTISVDGGLTWSSWYNQPTGQFYHVITDNQFPYISYAAQQDLGTAAVPNRSDYGEISFRDWFSIGGFEYSYIAPDPTDPNIVYSGGWYGSVVRFDKITGQITHVFVRSGNLRASQMPPLVFSPQDPHTLYLGMQFAMKTTDAGNSWQIISPDLTILPGAPAKSEKPQPSGAGGHTAISEQVGPGGNCEDAGAICGNGDEKEFSAQRPRLDALTVLAPSPASANVMWSGSSNGLVQRTPDGGADWQNVTPPGLPQASAIDAIEASRWDADTAYVALEARQDSHPYIYRTHDAGKSWQKITEGLQTDWVARVVREDPVRKGMLYAGTENALYVSFDDGGHWQSLQLNFPASDVRDLAVHGNDLVAATYGRALWILDDLSPLRQAAPEVANANAYLLHPVTAMRVRYDNDQETPLPPETPVGKNPPDGAIIDYYLKSVPSGQITLEIHDAQGKLVRKFTSVAPPRDTTPKNAPDYWFGPPVALSKNAGHNRFVWVLRYDSPPALNFSYYGNMLEYVEYTLSDHALPGDTPVEQTPGPLAVPGQYEIVLIANSVLMKQPLTIALDPRVHGGQADLEAQLTAAKRIDAGLASSYKAFNALAPFRAAIADLQKNIAGSGKANSPVNSAAAKEPAPRKDLSDALKDLAAKTDAILEGSSAAPGIGPAHRDLARDSFMIESGDAAPSESAKAALDYSCGALNKNLAAWRDLAAQTVPAVNALLEKYKLAPLPVIAASAIASPDACQE